MGKKTIIIATLCLGIVVVIYFCATQLNGNVKPTLSASPKIPAASLEKTIADKETAQFGDHAKILLYDSHSHLVFTETSSGIIPVLTNNNFTAFKKFIFPELDFQEFREETNERGPLTWQVENHVQKDFSVVYGFAEDRAKTIVINSEGNIQPNRFFVRDNLWVWYATVPKDKIKLPLKVTVYDNEGRVIYGGNKKENQ